MYRNKTLLSRFATRATQPPACVLINVTVAAAAKTVGRIVHSVKCLRKQY